MEPTNPAPPERQFDIETFDRITTNLGFDTDAKRQRALNMSNGTMSRLRAGKTTPSAKFIRRMVSIGVPYDAVFPVLRRVAA